MVVRLAVSQATAGLIALGLGVAVSGEALAQYNVLKECGSQYQAAKAANELGGRSWQDFLKECRTRLQEQGAAAPAEAAKPAEEAKPAEAAKPAPAEEPKAAETKPEATPAPAAEAPAAPNPLKPPPTTAQPAPAVEKPVEKPKDARAAMRERQKACAAEWKEKKKELIAADRKMTWPKFWSACNKRLKEEGQ